MVAHWTQLYILIVQRKQARCRKQDEEDGTTVNFAKMKSGVWRVTATLVGDDINIIYRGDEELVNHHLEWSVDHWMWA